MYIWDEWKTTVKTLGNKENEKSVSWTETKQLERAVKIFYNEEFDPGSGWTLATGLTHASRGAAGLKLASIAGDRRTGE